MQDSIFRASRWIILLLVSLSLTTLIACSSQQPAKSPQTLKSLSAETLRALDPQPPAPVITPALQPSPAVMPPESRLRSFASGDPLSANPDTVELKLLIIAAERLDETGTETESSLASWEAFLDQVGAPYETLIASEELLTAEFLVTPQGVGRFYGILLASNGLPHYDPIADSWPSAFSPEEWDLLFQYEREFNVREVALYTNPNPDPLVPTWPEDFDGLTGEDWGKEAPAGYSVHLTDEGKNIFPYINGNVEIPVEHAFIYPSTFAAGRGTTAKPILLDDSGKIMGVTSVSTDGRERLALTFAHHPSLLHTQLLGYGLIDWVTKGVFIGERRQYLAADVDDWFMATDRWDVEEAEIIDDDFHLSARDAFGLRNQQATLRGQYGDLAEEFTWTQAFNGSASFPAEPLSCDAAATGERALSAMTKCVADAFYWYNHTWSHEYMDPGPEYGMDYDRAFFQINENDKIVEAFGFGTRYSPYSLITGDVSGLGWYAPGGPDTGPKVDFGLDHSNLDFLLAVKATGRIYVASNMSTKSHEPSCTGCGIWHPLEPSILLVPRWPTNVFASVTTAEAATQAYNMVYAPGGTSPYYDHPLTFDEYLDAEAAIALRHVLSGSPYPHYFHVANAHEYESGHSLLYDWADRVVDTYSRYITLPLLSPKWDDLGALVDDRTSFRNAGISGTWNQPAGTLNIHSANGGMLFMTGVDVGEHVEYGADLISWRPMNSGESQMFTVAGIQPDVYYTLKLEPEADGYITASPAAPYSPGTTVTLTAIAHDPNWKFSGWTGDVPSGLTGNPIDLLMDGDKTIGAGFKWCQAFTITRETVGGGTIVLDPQAETYDCDSGLTATALPDPGWEFSGWSGDFAGAPNPAPIGPGGDRTISATFTERPPATYTLTIAAPTGGTISPSESGPRTADSIVTLTATADANWEFSRWTGDASGTSSQVDLLMNSDKTVGAEFIRTFQVTTSPNLHGTILLTPEGPTFRDGTDVTATAVPEEGWQFSGWTDGLTGDTNSLLFTVNSDMNIAAEFTQLPPDEFSLTILQTDGGSITPNKDAPYTANSTVSLTATPDIGWVFSNWTGSLSDSSNPAELLMDGNKTVGAVFTQIPTYEVTTSTTGFGNIALNPAGPIFLAGTEVTATATADTGSQFSGWSGAVTSTNPAITFTVNSDLQLEAAFTVIPPDAYVLTILPTDGGTISPASGTYTAGSTIEFQATPEDGWQFSSWTGDLSSETSNPVSLLMDGDKTVGAEFTQITYNVTTGTSGSGTIALNPAGPTFTAGTTVTATAEPTAGWIFSSWTAGLTGDTNPFTFTVNSDMNITAEFTEIPAEMFSLTILPTEGGSLSPTTGTHTAGTTVELTATPLTGWAFSNWTGDLSGTASTASLLMDDNKTVGAEFTRLNYTLTTGIIGEGTIELDPDGSPFPFEREVKATAVPAAGWTFTGWTGDVIDSNATTTVNMTGNLSITANFEQLPAVHTLTLRSNEGGSITADADGPYSHGSEVQLHATANDGWQFSNWTEHLSAVVDNPATLIMDGDKAVGANFTRLSYTVTTTQTGQGSIALNPAGGTYAHGTEVTATATPSNGWLFSGWTGGVTGSSNQVTFTVNRNMSFTGVFTKKPVVPPPPPPRPVRLTIRTAGLGSGMVSGAGIDCTSRNCSTELDRNSEITLTATPANGSTFAGWSGACRGTGDCTILMNRSQTVTARFSPPPPPVLLAVISTGSGSGNITSSPAGIDCSPTCLAMMQRGATVTLTATPATGSTFNGWNGGCQASTSTCTVSLERSQLVTARFMKKGR